MASSLVADALGVQIGGAGAVGSDDAFDALIGALAIDGCRDQLATLAPVADRVAALEGMIWRPAD